jgi:hypothetical protein
MEKASSTVTFTVAILTEKSCPLPAISHRNTGIAVSDADVTGSCCQHLGKSPFAPCDNRRLKRFDWGKQQICCDSEVHETVRPAPPCEDDDAMGSTAAAFIRPTRWGKHSRHLQPLLTALKSPHLHTSREVIAATHGPMQRASVLLLAAGAAFGLVQSTAGVSNATAEAPYSQALGLSCSVDTDCGYVPSLACIDGYALALLVSASTSSAHRLSCSYPGGATTVARGTSTAATTQEI